MEATDNRSNKTGGLMKDINSLAHTKWRCQYYIVFLGAHLGSFQKRLILQEIKHAERTFTVFMQMPVLASVLDWDLIFFFRFPKFVIGVYEYGQHSLQRFPAPEKAPAPELQSRYVMP